MRSFFADHPRVFDPQFDVAGSVGTLAVAVEAFTLTIRPSRSWMRRRAIVRPDDSAAAGVMLSGVLC